MRQNFLSVLFLLLSLNSFGAVWDNDIRFSSLTSLESGLPSAKGFQEEKFNVTTNYLFLSSSAMFTRSFGAEGIFSAGQYYYSAAYESKNEIKFSVNMLAAKFSSGGILLKAGRIFYGSPNTLMPYYGLYENYFGVTSSAADGVYASADLGKYFNIHAVAGKETEDYFSDGKSTVYGAVISARPFGGFELSPFIFNLRMDDKDLMFKRNLFVYGGALNWNFGGSNLYVSYAANGGNDKLYGAVLGGDTVKYGGSAWLVKFNSENETKGFYINTRFLYLKSSDMNIDKMSFRGIHSFINLGSIFTGTNLMRRAQAAATFNRHFAGSPDSLTAYNIGASLSSKFVKFIKIDFDLYSYSDAAAYISKNDIGSEINAGLTITPFKNWDFSVIYAKFYPGMGFKEQYNLNYVDVRDITQLAFKATLKF